MTQQSKQLLVTGLWGLGAVGGILLAVKRKSGFWGGVGWFLVFGMAGSAIGYVIISAIPTTKDNSSASAT